MFIERETIWVKWSNSVRVRVAGFTQDDDGQKYVIAAMLLAPGGKVLVPRAEFESDWAPEVQPDHRTSEVVSALQELRSEA